MRAVRARALALAAAVVLAAPCASRAETPPPAAALARYKEAGSLSNKGEFAKSAAAYRDVADWPDGGEFPLRAQALFLAGMQLESAREFEEALATYREVIDRFPHGRWASDARAALLKLDPPGARGVDFKRRLDEAWDVLMPQRRAPTGAEQAKGLALLERLLADHRDHPQACDVALAIGEARSKRGDLDGARAALEDAVSLAKREAAKPGADAAAASNVSNAEDKLLEAKRAILRRTYDRTACSLLVLALGVLVSVRPWRRSPRALMRLAAALIAADGVLAAVAVGVAEYVRRYIDDHSPLDDGAAALLVLGPGLTGLVVSLGIVNAVRGRRGVLLGAAAGVVAGAALAVMLVYAYGLFPFLDSEL